MIDAIGYILIFLLFFGIPIAIVLYGAIVALRVGRAGITGEQPSEENLPEEGAGSSIAREQTAGLEPESKAEGEEQVPPKEAA